MSSLRLNAPPCWFTASSSSLARRCDIVFSRRWRANSTSQRTARVRARDPGTSTGTWSDAPRADLEHGGERLDRLLERLDRVLAGALAEDRQRVVDDALGVALLAVQ